MANEPLRRTRPRPAPPDPDRPKIWVEGEQRPRFSMRGLRRATLHLAREAVVPINGWAARSLRRGAESVAVGAGRIPEGKLGRVERFVPSHLRVAAWIKNSAAVMAHASAVADLDVARGNALVAEIEPHLWPTEPAAGPVSPDPSPPSQDPAPSPFGADAPPVVLAEPLPPEPEPDPLAAIRDDLDSTAGPMTQKDTGRARAPSGAALPPSPPGAVATTAIQMTGYLVGWATVILALPYGLLRSLWLWLARNVDLRRVGLDD
jgi:hypothetical protein